MCIFYDFLHIHLYIETIKIYFEKNVDNDLCVATAINHLNEIFLKELRTSRS